MDGVKYLVAWLRYAVATPFVVLFAASIMLALLSGILGALISGKTKQIKDFL